jgi:hypothetical protein
MSDQRSPLVSDPDPTSGTSQDLSGVTLLAAAGLALILTALHNDNDIHGRLHLTG